MLRFENELSRKLVFAMSTHVYWSIKFGFALHRHVDPYMTIILQLRGSKVWSLCVPHHVPGVSPIDAVGRFMLNNSGKITFADEDVAGLKCDDVETFPGDVLFIQSGVPHSAVPGSNGSVHATFGVQDFGLRGRNLVEHTIRRRPSCPPTELGFWTRRRSSRKLARARAPPSVPSARVDEGDGGRPFEDQMPTSTARVINMLWGVRSRRGRDGRAFEELIKAASPASAIYHRLHEPRTRASRQDVVRACVAQANGRDVYDVLDALHRGLLVGHGHVHRRKLRRKLRL